MEKKKLFALLNATLKTRHYNGRLNEELSEMHIEEKFRFTKDDIEHPAPCGVAITTTLYNSGVLIDEFSASIPSSYLQFNNRYEGNKLNQYSALISFNDTHYNLDVYIGDDSKIAFVDVSIARTSAEQQVLTFSEHFRVEKNTGDDCDGIVEMDPMDDVYEERLDEQEIFAYIGRMNKKETEIEFMQVGKTTRELLYIAKASMSGDKDFYEPVEHIFNNEMECWIQLKNDIAINVVKGYKVSCQKTLD